MSFKWDYFDILATGQSDIHGKIKKTLLIRDLKPALNENVGSAKLLLEGAYGPIRNRETAQKNRWKPHNRKKFRPKPKTEIKVLTQKALVVFRISLSVINVYTYKIILLSEVLSGYSLVSAEHIVV